MIPSSVEAFHTEVRRLAHQHFPRSKWDLHEFNPLRLKMRIILAPELLIDVLYSASTQRIDFALIKETERVFGIDNLNEWHRHPFGGVEQHEAIEKPTLYGIFSEIGKVAVEQGLLREEQR